MRDDNYYKKSLINFVYALLPVIPLIIFLIVTDTLYTSVSHDKQEYKHCIEVLEKEREIAINTIIYNRIHQAKVQNFYISDDLDDKIRKKYGTNIEDVKDLIISKNMSVDILTVFGRVLIKDITIAKLYDAIEPDHVLLFSTKYGLIELNTTYSKAHITEFRNWETVLSRKMNKELATNAIDKLLTRSDDIVFWESNYSTAHMKETTISSPSREQLNNLIRMQNLDIFHYYNLLIPIYVTLGDTPTDLIIIREINIYRILEPYVYYLNQYATMIESYRHDMSKIIYVKVITCILISLALFVSFVLAMLSSFSKIYETRGD